MIPKTFAEYEADALEGIRELVRQGDISTDFIRAKLTFRQAEIILNPQLVRDILAGGKS